MLPNKSDIVHDIHMAKQKVCDTHSTTRMGSILCVGHIIV